MKNKIMLLALAAVSVVMFALPAIASAGSPEVSCGGAVCGKFTSHGLHSELTAVGEPEITCTSNSGAGEFTTKTTGTIALTFHGCQTQFFGFPVTCTSSSPAGGSPGTIKTTSSVFHTTYVTDAKTTPGILVTPGTNEHFSTIVCGGFATITVKGNGVIGHLVAPSCNAVATKNFTLNFGVDASGTQQYKQVTGTGTAYDLKGVTGNGTTTTSAMKAHGTVTLGTAGIVNCV
jgi:hypothetical protein